jgi:hypothetical protein
LPGTLLLNMEAPMTKSAIFAGLLFLGLGLEITGANASPLDYECEIKVVNSSALSKLFNVGDRMKISTADPAFILPEFTGPNGSLSHWNQISHPTLTIQSTPPKGFQVVFKGKHVSGNFVEENSIEIESPLTGNNFFGAWVQLSTDYGPKFRKDLVKMYASCTNYNP